MADPSASAARHHGSAAKYNRHQDKGHSSPRHASRGRSSFPASSSSRRTVQQAAGRGGKLPHATRRPRPGCCHDPEVRKGVGAVLFALGIPTAVAGIVMTVVAATDDDQDGKYPPAFSAVGPVLLVCAFLFCLSGFSLISPIMSNAIDRCFSFDDPTSFSRVHCPRLSHFIKPDPTIVINRAAMNALKTEPGKPALKRPSRPPSDIQGFDYLTRIPSVSESLPNDHNDTTISTQGSSGSTLAQVASVSETKGRRAGQKGVRFSESDIDIDVRRPRTVSASSDSSLLSLRNCKIYPKVGENFWGTDAHNDDIQEEWQDHEKNQMTSDL